MDGKNGEGLNDYNRFAPVNYPWIQLRSFALICG